MHHTRHKKRLIITLQLKNAEVSPGANLHGTVILQLLHKHNTHRHRTSSIESVDLTPNNSGHLYNYASTNSPKAATNLTIIDKVSISVSGICNINSSTDTSHFPLHLKQETDSFNILRGKENILGRALQLKQSSAAHFNDNTHHNNNVGNTDSSSNAEESIQFDFVVQLPPVLPASYSGYFVQYVYYAQLFVSISKHVNATKCRVPFYVLPVSSSNEQAVSNGKVAIPKLLTPMNLQERMSIFKKRRKVSHHAPSHSQHAPASNMNTPAVCSTVMTAACTPQVERNGGDDDEVHNHALSKPSPSLLLLPADSQFHENNLISTSHADARTFEMAQHHEEQHTQDSHDHEQASNEHKLMNYLRKNSLTLNYRDSNSLNNTENDYGNDINTFTHYNSNNKFKISLENNCIGELLLNDTVFCDGERIEGYLSLYTPCIVKVTLIHIEQCGAKQKHLTNCCSSYQCCWYSPSFTFTLKIPNNAFKSFKSDLCESSWSLHFEFAISKHLLSNKHVICSPDMKQSPQTHEVMGYLNTAYDVWKLHGHTNGHSHNVTHSRTQHNDKEIDKILKWQLPIVITTMHNPLRCVTRSNAVVVKC